MIPLILMYGLVSVAAGMLLQSFIPVLLWIVSTVIGWAGVALHDALVRWVKAKTS